MTADDGFPTFDEDGRSIFAIEESRLRADTMRDVLVPKLRQIVRIALGMIEDTYKIDPLASSTETASPEHRANAAKTKNFRDASAGLVKRQVEGKYHYLKLVFTLSASGLLPSVEAYRPVESEALFDVLRDYKLEVLQLLGDFGINVWTNQEHDREATNGDIIEATRVTHTQQWWQSGLVGSQIEYPIDSDDQVGFLVEQFVAMYPVYQATCERLAGLDDQFRDYYRLHLDAFPREDHGSEDLDDDSSATEDADFGDSLNPEPSAVEGEIVRALILHRRRERRLREEKIREVVQADGRLRCEVPGCAFDFFEVYGEIGAGFAHVHHVNPLGDRSEPSETKLSELAVVCANCHAMIHRGGTVRPLEQLIRRGRPDRV